MDLKQREEILEKNLCKYQLKPLLRNKAKYLPIPFNPDSIEYSISIELLAQMLFFKRKELDILIGMVYTRFKDINQVLEIFYQLVDSDLLDYNSDSKQVITVYSLEPEEEEKLQQMMYPQPMLLPPKKVVRNSDTGYRYLPKSSIVLRNSFFKEDVNLDHINRVNSVPLRINKEVLENLEHKPKKTLPTVKDRENWNRFVRQQREIAESYKDDTFYLTHKYDKRGRIYCQGYHITYQGDDYSNALVEFANGEKL